MATALVTGAAGFVGGHLSRLLVARGARVVGTYQAGRPAPAIAGVSWRAFELGDRESTRALIAEVAPDDIYHLASPAFVPAAQAAPEATVQAIITGTFHLLEAAASSHRRFLYVGSGEEYAPPATPTSIIDEQAPLGPKSLYGACKVAATQLALSYKGRPGFKVVAVRPFNQIGPGQSPDFAVASFAQQIAAMLRSGAERVLRVGNVEVERDFIDIEDSVGAHVAALEHGADGEVYNICSGTPTRLRALIDVMIESAGFPVEVERDPARVRANDVPRVQGSAAKLAACSGWVPASTARAAAVRAMKAFAS